MTNKLALFLTILILTGCGPNLDSVMWGCQLMVQRDNAGKSASAAEEKARDIEACMEERGYRLDVEKRACQHGSVDSTCYRAK